MFAASLFLVASLVLPFVWMITMPDWRALLILAAMASCVLGWLYFDLSASLETEEGDGIAGAFALVWVGLMFISSAAGFIMRALILACRRR